MSDRRLRLWLGFVFTYLAIATLGRIALLDLVPHLFTASPLRELAGPLALTFAAGLANDLATGLVLGLPFLIALFVFPRWLAHADGWRFARTVAAVMPAVFIMVAVGEYYFFVEFAIRPNRLILAYLEFPREAFGFLLDALLEIAAAGAPLALLVAATARCLREPMRRAFARPPTPFEQRRAFVACAVLSGFAALGLSNDPLRPTGVRELDEIAANGLYTLARAARAEPEDYDSHYPTLDEEESLRLVRDRLAQDNATFLAPESVRSFLRRVSPDRPAGAGPRFRNVVLVIEESLGMSLVEGNHEDGTPIAPRLNALAAEGLYFDNIHATGTRTVRGIEAIMTSFPPIPGASTARRPGSEEMNSLPLLLAQEGFETAFLYAGRAGFDGMAPFMSTIGVDTVLDQDDILESGFETVWGVADEYLFAEAIRRLDARRGDAAPYFMTLLTVSNHTPFAFPEGRIDRPAAPPRQANVASYADWAIGDFIDRARTRPWFDDTLFVVMADHGPRLAGSETIPMEAFRIPVLFLNPSKLGPRRVHTLGSSIDVGPTIAGLLGTHHVTPLLGVDLLQVPAERGRAVMEHNYAIAFAADGEMTVLVPDRDPEGYRIGVNPTLSALAKPSPAHLRETIAHFQTAHRMFYSGGYHEITRGLVAPDIVARIEAAGVSASAWFPRSRPTPRHR